MLTLKTADIPTLEIELSSGERIHVLPATKRIIDSMGRMDTHNPNMEQMYKVLAMILSYNTEGKTITEDDLSEVPVPVVAEVIRQYMDFIKGKINDEKN